MMRLTAIKNAAVKFGPQLKEVRVHFCQTSPESNGAREFVAKHYRTLKESNPNLPILIRECSGIQPRIWVRHEFGKEQSALVTNFGHTEILEAVKKLGNS